MTMSPDRFRELLDRSTADAPPAQPGSYDVAAGQARLRRRRLTLAASGVAVAVVLAAAVGLGTRLGGADDRGVEPISPHLPAGPSQAEVDRIVAACQDAMPQKLLEQGPLHVATTASSAFSVEALFASEQDRYWAACSDSLLGDDTGPVVSPYDAQKPADDGSGAMIGPACPEREGCRDFGLSFSARRDPVVAAVRVDLADGQSLTFESADGFYASAVGALPEQASFGDDGLVAGTCGLCLMHQVTLLDSTGAPIAAEVMDGTGSGLGQNEVAGLPLLDAYPELGGIF